MLHESLPADSLDIVIVTNECTEDIGALAGKFNARAIDCSNDLQDLHSLAICDIMLTSNSGFSYLATLINRNALKIVPDNFWHHWPLGSVVFDGSDIAASTLLQKFARWEEGNYRPSALRSFKSERIWYLTPSMVAASNREFRDANYVNIASPIKMLPLALQNEAASRIGFPAHIQSRKLYGCVVNTVSQLIELEANLGNITEIISEPSVFIQFRTSRSYGEQFYKSAALFLKAEFNEAIMGRTILVPPEYPITCSEFLALGFHQSISVTSLVSPLVYCSDLIALHVNTQSWPESK